MPRSQTTPDRSGARVHAPIRVAFRHHEGVGVRDCFFTAQYSAYAIPCPRFAHVLAAMHARPGAGVARYAFTVRDSHSLLLAGLPAHHGELVEP